MIMANGERILPSKSKAKELLWKAGNLQWKLDKNQLGIRQFIHEKDNTYPIVISASRRLGKSYTLLVISMEECLRNPNYMVNYVAPTSAMLRNILFPMIEEILQDCPQKLRPLVSVNQNSIKFKNGSEIKLAGTDNKRADKLRGRASHLCIVDEAGFCNDLQYVVDSILSPTTLTTNGKTVLISTPPISMDHPYIGFTKKAEFTDRFMLRTIYDNPRLTEKQIQIQADQVGGRDSNQFRREFMCELIQSVDDVVIPEFNKELQKSIVRDTPLPAFYDAYVGMDIGGKDFTGLVFAYYDFQEAKIVILDELLLKGSITSDEIALKTKIKEADNFRLPGHGSKAPFLRVSDNNNVILLQDLQSKHGLYFMPTAKDDRIAAINNLRLMIKDKMLIISPKCKNLIFQLENATWRKSSKDSFSRSSTHGHWDLLSALIYLCRNIQLSKNPTPSTEPGFNQFRSNTYDNSSQFETGLKQIFKIKPRRF
jgi:uncharacterized protein YneF (UPF0154 family)